MNGIHLKTLEMRGGPSEEFGRETQCVIADMEELEALQHGTGAFALLEELGKVAVYPYQADPTHAIVMFQCGRQAIHVLGCRT